MVVYFLCTVFWSPESEPRRRDCCMLFPVSSRLLAANTSGVSFRGKTWNVGNRFYGGGWFQCDDSMIFDIPKPQTDDDLPSLKLTVRTWKPMVGDGWSLHPRAGHVCRWETPSWDGSLTSFLFGWPIFRVELLLFREYTYWVFQWLGKNKGKITSF